MMSKCIVPKWNLSHQRQDQAEAEEGINRSSHVENLHNPSYIVPMSNYGVMELKWESGPPTMHGRREISFNTPSMKPTWDKTSYHTLESITHKSTCHNQNTQMPLDSAGLLKKRLRLESNKSGRYFGCTNIQDEHAEHSSTCASASITTWPSQEPLRSVKTKSTDEDLACHGGTENKNGENRTTKEETVRSQPTRSGRAAAIHNQSERRRRDRINQKMKALQKLVPNASKTDKASMLDEVIAYLKHLQAQFVHLMSARRSMPQTIMMPPGILHHLHMSSIPPAGAVTAAAFGPPPFVVPQGIQAWPPSQANTDAAFLAQARNMGAF